jgi:hypothetical protein
MVLELVQDVEILNAKLCWPFLFLLFVVFGDSFFFLHAGFPSGISSNMTDSIVSCRPSVSSTAIESPLEAG